MPVPVCLLLLLMYVGSTSAQAMTWTSCTDETGGSVKATTVQLSPDPPVIGSPATFTVMAHSDAEVATGSVEISISFMGIEIFSKSEDLCLKTTCPVKPGDLQIVLVEDLPPIAPPGSYGLRLQARSSSDEDLLCLDVNFELVPPSGTLAGGAAAALARDGSKWHAALELARTGRVGKEERRAEA